MRALYIGAGTIIAGLIIWASTQSERDLSADDNIQCPLGQGFLDPTQPEKPDNKNFVLETNCDFHQWSWQEFLWLTSDNPETGEPHFLSFTPPSALVDNGATSAFLPRNAKTIPGATVDEFLQAGPNGLLIDPKGNAIYYSQHLNPTYVDFLKNNFFGDKNAFDYKKVLEKLKSDPNIAFPDDAMELKISWQIVEDGMDTSTYFTMPATVQKLANEDGRIVLGQDTMDVNLRMVGFHIGAVVNGHTEMIWATFEHWENTPNVFYAESDTDFRNSITATTVISDENFNFYNANTPASKCNVNNGARPILPFDEAKQKFDVRDAIQVCRWFDSGDLLVGPDGARTVGGQAATTRSINLINIQTLNQVTNDLMREKESPWAEYFEVGAIWFINAGSLKPGLSLADNTLLTGSIGLSNSTIETFTQVSSTQYNCFRCHNTLEKGLFNPIEMEILPASNLNISHAFSNLFMWSQPAGGVETNAVSKSR